MHSTVRSARRFNLINIYLLIFPFGRAAPIVTPSNYLISLFTFYRPSSRLRGGVEGPSNYFIRGIPRVFVHAFVLRLLTAGRALRKSATSCARLHFINSDFLRFPLHTTCRRVVRQTQHHETSKLFFSSMRRIWKRERTQPLILQIFISDEMLWLNMYTGISLDKPLFFHRIRICEISILIFAIVFT